MRFPLPRRSRGGGRWPSSPTVPPDGPPRPPTPSEQALLDALLRDEFSDAEELRAQARQVSVSPGCGCGCGTLDLHVPAGLRQVSSAGPLPIERTVVDEDGEPIGGLLLFLDDGFLSHLEVYSFVDDPLPMPPPERVLWDEPGGP